MGKTAQSAPAGRVSPAARQGPREAAPRAWQAASLAADQLNDGGLGHSRYELAAAGERKAPPERGGSWEGLLEAQEIGRHYSSFG